MSRIDAQQAADRLGVKVETVYAYVSRGLLPRERGPDGRSSTFLVDDVERLARRGRPRRSTRGPAIDVSITTSLTEIDRRRLRYRGIDAVELAGSCTFEQVAELLWSGGIPVPPPVWPPGRPLPFTPADATMLDRLRLAVALDACAPRPPVSFGADGAALLVEEGPGLVATMVGALPIRGRPPVRGDDPTVGPDGAPGPIAERLAVRLSGGRPRRALVELVDAALVLLADHEMATSTFAARLAASVRADAHAVVSAGMGPVAGPLHGQASRAVRRMLDDAVATSPVAVARRSSIRRSPAPGIGHGLYPHGDPRAVELLGRLRSSGGPPRRLRLVEELLTELDRAGAGRANVDFALGALGHVWSMPVDAGEAIFTVARSVGWLAHGAEEWSRRPLRFRARARYVPARADGTA